EVVDLFERACRRDPDFLRFSGVLVHAGTMLQTLRGLARDERPESVEQWVAAVIIAYVSNLGPTADSVSRRLEDASLREFTFGEGSPEAWPYTDAERVPQRRGVP